MFYTCKVFKISCARLSKAIEGFFIDLQFMHKLRTRFRYIIIKMMILRVEWSISNKVSSANYNRPRDPIHEIDQLVILPLASPT